MVSFTGSTRTGRKVLEGQLVNFKRVALELGGKSAAIVFGDADLKAAVDGVMFSIFMHQGQVCCAGSRLLVEDSFADTFLSALVARAKQLVVGDLRDERTDIGPLISRQHFAVVSQFVEQAGDEGAEVLCGGGAAAGESLVFLPTVLDRVDPSMTVFNEEIFGPVLTVTRFRTPDEAVMLANQSQYGLAGSVWTSSIDVAFDVAKRVRTGTIEINTSLEGQPQLPFGGYKASGMGREKGTTGLAEFTETKTIGLRTARRPSFFSAPA
jgi:acyl-CoA reductase-like NAD-dependent aldehyde dehydrogenase